MAGTRGTFGSNGLLTGDGPGRSAAVAAASVGTEEPAWASNPPHALWVAETTATVNGRLAN